MADYIIRIDTATKPREYGESTAAWITCCGGSVINAGLNYFIEHGTNKIVYEGILAALYQLETEHFYPAGFDTVKVYCDCAIVINQINNKTSSIRMKKYKDKVDRFCRDHKNVTFEFLHQSKHEPEFKKVDRLSKVGRNWIKKMTRG